MTENDSWDFDQGSAKDLILANYPGAKSVRYLVGFEADCASATERFASTFDSDVIAIGESAAWGIVPYYNPMQSSFLVKKDINERAGLYREVDESAGFIELVKVDEELFDKFYEDGVRVGDVIQFLRSRVDSDRYDELIRLLEAGGYA